MLLVALLQGRTWLSLELFTALEQQGRAAAASCRSDARGLPAGRREAGEGGSANARRLHVAFCQRVLRSNSSHPRLFTGRVEIPQAGMPAN